MRPRREHEDEDEDTRTVAEWHVLQTVVREKRALVEDERARLNVENVAIAVLIALALAVPSTVLSTKNWVSPEVERTANAVVASVMGAGAASLFAVRHLPVAS